MDDEALFRCSVGSALHALDRAEHLLEVAHRAGGDQLSARLVEGQFDCAEQLRTVTIFALRCVMPVIGRDWSLVNWGADAASLQAQMVHAKAEIEGLSLADFDSSALRRVIHTAGDAELDQTAADYLLLFAIPNLWFHLSMAYGILRSRGVPVGKADFDGLHAYAPDFRFV